jgi:hypothetical protein
VPQPVERALDGLPLRIEHSGLVGDENASFHNYKPL